MASPTAPKILLVDDEEEFVLTLAERLETRGLGARVVHSGEAALASIAQEVPDLMVLDLNMPGMNGIEVLRNVREIQVPTKVIILTGHGSEQERRLSAELGAVDYLNKPVDIKALSDAMKRALEQVESDVPQVSA